MSQCQSLTKNGKQCTRNTLPSGRYCWQHNVSFLLTMGVVIPIILTLIGLWADLFSLGFLTPKERSNSTYSNLMARGVDAFNIGQYDEALNYYNQALVIVREVGDRSGEGDALYSIGSVYQATGKNDQALEYYNQALVIAREIGDRSGEGYALNNIGSFYQATGQNDQALEYYKQALVIVREIGLSSEEKKILDKMSQLPKIP